jgi:hypothetical protein
MKAKNSGFMIHRKKESNIWSKCKDSRATFRKIFASNTGQVSVILKEVFFYVVSHVLVNTHRYVVLIVN